MEFGLGLLGNDKADHVARLLDREEARIWAMLLDAGDDEPNDEADRYDIGNPVG